MAWRDKLRQASFRGVKFEVESAEMTFGRRIAPHEYPQRDLPYPEDMGRKAREYQVEAFILGDLAGQVDYMEGRDKLLEAIETAGPGQLVHPYHGTLLVVAQPNARLVESTREGGMAKFTIVFSEAGKAVEPATATDTGAKLGDTQLACDAAYVKDFSEKFTIDGAADFVVDDALEKAGSILELPEISLGDLNQLRANATSELAALLPENLRASLSNGLTFALGVVALVRGATSLTSLFNFSDNLLSTVATVTTASPSRANQISNQVAIANLVQQAATTRQVVELAESEPTTVDETQLARSQIVSSVDVVLFGEGISSATADAMVQLRTDAVSHLAATTVDQPRLFTVTPKLVLPAVVLAHDLYGDTWDAEGRDIDLVGRNEVKHPGFVPAGVPLKFVTE